MLDVKIFMAQSVNSKIARKTGEEDFLSARNWREFKKIAEKTGVFAVGRKTYEEVKKWEEKGFEDINADRIIISSNEKFQTSSDYITAVSPEDAIGKVEKRNHDELLVTGGASINTSFLTQDMVSKIILNLEPCLLGRGINLFDEERFEKNLNLESVKELDEDIVQLIYCL